MLTDEARDGPDSVKECVKRVERKAREMFGVVVEIE